MSPSSDNTEQEIALYQAALAEKAPHAAVLHLVRARWLAGGALDSPHPRSELNVVIAKKIHPRIPAAFLASFNFDGDPATHYVFPLKPGVNRIGKSPHGDHVETADRLLEPRQWLIVCGPEGKTWIVDDRSTNESSLVPASLNLPRSKFSNFMVAQKAAQGSSGPLRLDGNGDHVYAIEDGDVLVAAYSSFVFGVLPQQPEAPKKL